MAESICKNCRTKIKVGPYCLNRSDTILEFISSKWSFHIISIITQGERPLRFNEIETRLKEAEGSFSPKTLSQRLKEAEKLGLLKREIFPEIPPRVEYSTTEKGKAFYQAIIPLLNWTIEWTEHDCNRGNKTIEK